MLSKIAASLPVQFLNDGIRIGKKEYRGPGVGLVMVYPNPLNPKHYVVINSGFTFSEAAPTSNALQIPKLPDYAVFDLTTQTVADAGFFDEAWKLQILQ